MNTLPIPLSVCVCCACCEKARYLSQCARTPVNHLYSPSSLYNKVKSNPKKKGKSDMHAKPPPAQLNSTLKNKQPLPLQPPQTIHIASSLHNRLHSRLTQLPPLLRSLLLAARFRLTAPRWRHAPENLPAIVGREVDEANVARGGRRLARRLLRCVA